jgi:hypothetical protein
VASLCKRELNSQREQPPCGRGTPSFYDNAISTAFTRVAGVAPYIADWQYAEKGTPWRCHHPR